MLRHSTFLALLLLLLCCGCGGSTTAQKPDDGAEGPAGDAPDSAGVPHGQVLHSTSGVPVGIRLAWFPVQGGVTGYHIYFSDQPIPDSARGDNSFWLSIGGNDLIPQPGGSSPISVDHLFSVQIGETWYYRLSSVWTDPDTGQEESILSPETQVDITPFTVASIENPNVGVGTIVFIDGDHFGQQDVSDTVEFPGVQWVDGTGFVPAKIPGQIQSWTNTRIGVTVPLGTTSGNIDVTIGGLTASTPDTFTNSQPYITSLTPLGADITEDVTLVGNNFGNAQDTLHFVKFAGFDMTAAVQYTSWSNTQIVFHPLNLRQFEAKEVRVGVLGFLSNIGFLNLENAPPVVFLTASPSSGTAPLAVKFEPQEGGGTPGGPVFAYDPEGTTLTYGYDFEDDGSIDITMPDASQVPHTYNPGLPTARTCRLTCADQDGGTGDDTVVVNVANPAIVVTDDGTSTGKPLFQSDGQLTIKYDVSGGAPNYDVTWVLTDDATNTETILATDLDVSPGPNVHNFDIDTTTSTAVAGSDLIPFGKWHIRAEAEDQDPAVTQGTFTWPDPLTFDVFRYDIGMINDAAGDPGGTESTAITADLVTVGYKVTQVDAATMQISDLNGFNAVVVPGQYSSGQAQPYGWLSTAEIGVLTSFIDLGGQVIILAPPCIDSAAGPFPQDNNFNANLQPFASIVFANDQTLTRPTLDFTLLYDHMVRNIVWTSADLGRNAPGTPLLNGAVGEIGVLATGAWFGAYRDNAVGGGVYLGMFQYDASDATGVGESRALLLDNIVAGSINQ